MSSPACTFFLPDRLEALIAAGRFTDAQRDIAEWDATGRRHDRAFAEAITHHQRFDWPHQHGRTRLAYGITLRRAGRRRDARAHLDAARNIFDCIGESLWADRTRDELARRGGRTPAGQALTDAERRVAQLVASGHPNREVAAELSISVKPARN